ncbi:hypothetical protein DYH09_21750 [bacterium CPR1]|nr:hypothetical protein [bacterium CPR1]
MELVPGKSLEEVIQERSSPLDEGEFRRLMVDSLAILDHLHSHSPPIVHRDFKPANLLRTDAGELKLVDFGISRHRARGQRDTQVIGTEGYASPEQCAGMSEPATDLFAWGATMFFAATRQHPLASWPPYPELTSIRRDLSPELGRILSACKAHNPADRPTAHEVLGWLAGKAPDTTRPPEAEERCPQCQSTSPPLFLDCCPDCTLSRGLHGLSAVEWAARGEELLRQGVYVYAASHLSRAIKLAPSAVAWHLPLARALTRSGRPTEALQWLRKCTADDEVTTETAFAQLQVPSERAAAPVTLQTSKGPLARALQLFLSKDASSLEQLARQCPEHSPIAVLAIRLKTIQGRHQEATELAEEFLKNAPADASLLRQRMQLTWESEQSPECRLATMALRRVAPWDPLAAHFLGRLLARDNNIGRAVEEFRRYLDFCPHDVKAQLELVEILSLKAGRLDEAIALLEPLVDHEQFGEKATDQLIRILQLGGNHQRAVTQLRPRVHQGSEPARMAQLAFSLQQIGKKTEARAWAELALAADPDCELARLVRDGKVQTASPPPPARLTAPKAAPAAPPKPTAPMPAPSEAARPTAILRPEPPRPTQIMEPAQEGLSYATKPLPRPLPSWANAFKDPSVQGVFLHLESYGSITEVELVAFLGSPREVRRFSKDFADHLKRLPFQVMVESSSAGKRYVKL